MAADIQQACNDIPDIYVYYSEREPIWRDACAQAFVDMEAAETGLQFLVILERLLDDLYDPHISLNTNSDQSPRLVPSGTDIWLVADPTGHVIVGVRPKSGAAQAGVQPGDRLVSFNGLTPNALIATRIHAKPERMTASRVNWALNASIAGYRHEPRILVVERAGAELRFDLGNPEPAGTADLITTSLLDGEIGYIRFNNSLGNDQTVTTFDDALDSLSETQGLVLDLRDTPGGGNTGVAEPVLGRLVDASQPYQVTIDPVDGQTIRSISPTGAWTYKKPIIALVGRWTGSMGEGMAIGLDGMQRAEIMGDCMAALAGGVNEIRLEQSGISVRVPAYDLIHVDGTPRHEWCVETPVTADAGDQDDTLLAAAIVKLRHVVED